MRIICLSAVRFPSQIFDRNQIELGISKVLDKKNWNAEVLSSISVNQRMKPRKDLNTESARLTSRPNRQPTVIPQTPPKSTSHWKPLICEASSVGFLSPIIYLEKNKPIFRLRVIAVQIFGENVLMKLEENCFGIYFEN